MDQFILNREETNSFSYQEKIQFGAPQVTILGPLLFFIYILGLGKSIKSKKNIIVDEEKKQHGSYQNGT